MKRHNLTSRSIEALRTPEKGIAVLRDSAVAGLGVKALASGRRVFFWSRRRDANTVDYKTIGDTRDVSLDLARTKASEYNAQMGMWKMNGRVGAAPLDVPKTLTFEAAFEQYVEGKLLKKGSDPEPKRWVVRRYLRPLAAKPLDAITREELDALHRHIGEKNGKAIADRALKLISAVYRWHAKHGFTGENPCVGIEFYGGTERDRFLSDEEMARLLAALDEEKNIDLRDYVMLSLLTGARKGNVYAMRWDDVQADANGRRFWKITKTKTKKDYSVPLVEEALGILARRKRARRDDNPWVFPSYGPSGHLVTLQAGWYQLLERAKIEDFTQHDLRRTFGSRQAATGASLLVIGKSLGHRSTASTAIYARLNLDPVRASVELATRAMLAGGKK